MPGRTRTAVLSGLVRRGVRASGGEIRDEIGDNINFKFNQLSVSMTNCNSFILLSTICHP